VLYYEIQTQVEQYSFITEDILYNKHFQLLKLDKRFFNYLRDFKEKLIASYHLIGSFKKIL
jgi:hypothetical protein